MEFKNQLFNSLNTIKHISEKEYKQLSNYLQAVEAFSRITYSSVYIIDYYTKEFEYVSDNPLFLCGKSAKEVKALGYDFYYSFVADEDIELLHTINRVGFEFYKKIDPKERLNYSISYDFNLKNENGNTFLINHKLTPLFLTEEGDIWKAICIVSLSNRKESGNISIYKQNENSFWHYDLEGKFWKAEEQIHLSEREQDILSLSIQGYTINEVAERMFVTPATIKFHRKKLFEKLQVANIAEALAVVTNNKIM